MRQKLDCNLEIQGSNVMPKITLDDIEFNSEDLSESGKKLFLSLQFTEAKIKQLQNEQNVFRMSKALHENAIKQMLQPE